MACLLINLLLSNDHSAPPSCTCSMSYETVCQSYKHVAVIRVGKFSGLFVRCSQWNGITKNGKFVVLALDFQKYGAENENTLHDNSVPFNWLNWVLRQCTCTDLLRNREAKREKTCSLGGGGGLQKFRNALFVIFQWFRVPNFSYLQDTDPEFTKFN